MLNRFITHISHTWRFGVPPKSPLAFVWATACVGVATAVMATVDFFRPDILTHAAYYPAALFATLIGGAWAGVLALALGAVLAWWIFEPAYLGPLADEHTDLALYLISSLLIVWAAEKYRIVVRTLDEEEHYRKLVVEELSHRLKNKVASVYAIIGYELKEHSEIWEKVQGRLRTLALTDDFIAKSDRESVSVVDILNAELRPYDSRRVLLTGDPVHLPPKLAVSLALIFHELTTNAAKYGSLSTSAGRIDISWHKTGSYMKMIWVERDGPPATPPASGGFGRRLLERGLDPFHGTIEQKFSSEGFSAHIAFVIPDDYQHPLLPILGRRPNPTPVS